MTTHLALALALSLPRLLTPNEELAGQSVPISIPIPMGLYPVQVWIWVQMLAPGGIPMPIPSCTSALTILLCHLQLQHPLL